MNTKIIVREKLAKAILSVPVRIKIAGIMVLPVFILGFALTYWIRTGLSDWLSYLLTDERVRIAMENGSRSVIFVTLLAALISILLTFVLMLMLTRPLLDLREVAHRVGDGDLTSRVHIWAKDEIGEVSEAVNQMLDSLVFSQQKLRRTNRRLEAINRVVLAASRELDLVQVLDASLKTTLDIMQLDSGWILLRDPYDQGSPQFQLASHHGLTSIMESELSNVGEELCACQKNLLEGKLGQKIITHPCFRLSEIGKSVGMPTDHITIPLDLRDQRFGIINLVCPQERVLSSDDIDLLKTIGVHLSEIITNAQLHSSLVEKEAVRQTLLKALVKAQEDEQARLARELHDGAGQTLTSLLIRLKVLEKQSTTTSLRRDLSDLCQDVSEIIEQLRGISYRLRPSILEEFGLVVAIQTLVEDMTEAAGIESDCRLQLGDRRLPFEIESTLYRIAQESLTNVIRHAQADWIQVELTALPYAICLRVEDNGVGFDPDNIKNGSERPRLGLLGMQERVEMLGGSLLVQSAPGGGTSVQVRVPIEVVAIE